ncbi:hypothetical protein NEMBOFW57_007161 [Staphylotrichum longicolle]|uniref:Uncharacterized protein n=1 Tax=Staphylotrichum longicolle TaxID=669026 RepID=A0AAD4EYN5_9PEZI|nr:hypothetical protein NEMBOFW57_007161 [Staphylotrichum longicolle]
MVPEIGLDRYAQYGYHAGGPEYRGYHQQGSFISQGANGLGNETNAYEIDLATPTFRTLYIKTDIFCAAGVTLPDKAARQLNIRGWASDATYSTRLLYPFLAVMPSVGISVQYWNEARILDPVTFSTIKTLPNAPGAIHDDNGGCIYPLDGPAVLLPQECPYADPLVVLVCGGSTIPVGNAIDNCMPSRYG